MATKPTRCSKPLARLQKRYILPPFETYVAFSSIQGSQHLLGHVAVFMYPFFRARYSPLRSLPLSPGFEVRHLGAAGALAADLGGALRAQGTALALRHRRGASPGSSSRHGTRVPAELSDPLGLWLESLGRGSTPMVPFWGRFTTHWIGMFTGGTGFSAGLRRLCSLLPSTKKLFWVPPF